MAELGPVLVVIPTYQERENLRPVLTRLHAAVPDAEVLVRERVWLATKETG